MLTQKGYLLLGYAFACLLLVFYTFGEDSGNKGGKRTASQTVSSADNTAVKQATATATPTVPPAVAKPLVKPFGEDDAAGYTMKATEEWVAEDKSLTHDLPFLTRTEAVESALAKINSNHAAKHAAAYPNGKLPPGTDPVHQLHLFFTTDCSQHSLWQSLSLEHSWAKVGHPGALSRLVSGCIQDNGNLHPNQKLMERQNIDHERFFIFFGPRIDASAVPGPEGSFARYAPINRPATVYYWMMMVHAPEIVMGLLDPDMIFLKPLAYPPVSLGKPVGQYYDYLISEDWDRVYPDICKSCPPLQHKPDYCPGPPHLMHKKDWGDLVQWWLRYTVEARKKWGKWVSEMAGMSIGLARLGLRSRIDRNGMWDRPNDEFFGMMKRRGLDDPGAVVPLKPQVGYLPLGLHPLTSDDLPSTFHYCFTPEIGRDTYPERFWKTNAPQEAWEAKNRRPLFNYIHWSKYRVPGDWPGGDGSIPRDGSLLDCRQELLFEYPPITYLIHHYGKTKVDRAWAVFISSVVPNINEAVIEYRKRHCPTPRRYRKNIRSSHPQSWKSKFEISYNTTHPRGFTFVTPEGEVRSDWEDVKFEV
eukprot:TRINITY_DN14889_c0_g1_i1.p1 TRINITY_DN14889_c0_g1~~TRINITY_DN14889_c0_g1_i1.p1  ORF type:complete len:606 (+),score=167.05 TRINITY_DN14889_c0_g1_i1:62-1819(+)